MSIRYEIEQRLNTVRFPITGALMYVVYEIREYTSSVWTFIAAFATEKDAELFIKAKKDKNLSESTPVTGI